MLKRIRDWWYKFASSYAREKWLDDENKYLKEIKRLEMDNLALREYIKGVHVGMKGGRR